jgi:transposase
MSETRRKFNQDFREGAVPLVLETGKPIAQVARDLGITEGTLRNWIARERQGRGEGGGVLGDGAAELVRLRRENAPPGAEAAALSAERISSSTTRNSWSS